MLKQGTFINKKYYIMMIYSLLTELIDIFNTVLDAILGGIQLGEVALQAVSIVTPVSYVISFFGFLFAPGCALLFGPNHVRIIVRDNGVIFNFVDENNSVESLNAHVLNSLLERTEDKQYLITTSFNRNGFVFEK